MNMTPIPARAAKFIGAGVLAVSLLAVTAGCSAGETKSSAPAESAAPTASAAATPSAQAKKTLTAQFVRVIDGDTIEVQPVTKGQPNGEPNVTVHLLGVNAPEATACGGAESAANLTSLFQNNEPVRIDYEPTLDKDTDKDGNTLAWVTTGAGVTQDLGLRVVQDGFAVAEYPKDQTAPKKFNQYAEMGKIALDQKLGIWATCPAPTV